MKRNSFFSLAVISILAAVTFTNCKKEGPDYGFQGGSNTSVQQASLKSNYLLPGERGDRIDEIVKDLSSQDYSLSFEKPIPSVGITRTSYGSDSYVVFADPQDLICPEPIRWKYKRVPIWKLPNFIFPTCPDMIIDINRIRQVRELLVKGDPAQFKGLKEIGLSNGGGFLATEKLVAQYSNLRLDKIDDLTNDLNGARFMMFHDPNTFNNGFQRNFYGFADIPNIVLRPNKLNLKDILKPTLKGCFDPLILSIIKERLQRFDPVTYKGLNVTPLEQNKEIAVMSF